MLSLGGSAGPGLVWQPCSRPLHRRHGPETPGWHWDDAWLLLVLEQEPESNPETSGSYRFLTTFGEMDVLASKYLWHILTTPCCFPLGLTSQSNE